MEKNNSTNPLVTPIAAMAIVMKLVSTTKTLRETDPKRHELLRGLRKRRRGEARSAAKKAGHRPGSKCRKCKRCGTTAAEGFSVRCDPAAVKKAREERQLLKEIEG